MNEVNNIKNQGKKHSKPPKACSNALFVKEENVTTRAQEEAS
jgi:hypothetical protein